MPWPGEQAPRPQRPWNERGAGPWPCPRTGLWCWAVCSFTGEGTDNQDEAGRQGQVGGGALGLQAEAQGAFLPPLPPPEARRGTAGEDLCLPSHPTAVLLLVRGQPPPRPTWGFPAQTTAPGRLPWPLATSLPWPSPHPAQPPAQKWQHLLAPIHPPLTLLQGDGVRPLRDYLNLLGEG